MRKHILLIFGLSLVSLSIVSISAEPNTIPDWVKNNALWWAEGQIGESDFIGAMQYLINQGVIIIPVTSVVATDINLSESDRAMHVVVHYMGEIFGVGETIYTYSEFQHLGQAIRTTSTGIITTASDAPQFYLSGLPSHDKKTVYRLVEEFVNPGRPPAQYDIAVDIISGDGKIIQIWDYRKCDLVDYVTYLDSSELNYRFSDKDEPEIREIILWECAGFHLLVP